MGNREFKVGDEVEIIEACSGTKVGEIYKLSRGFDLCAGKCTCPKKWKLKGEKGETMDAIKSYLEKHRDIFLTIGIILILDHFIFAGAFKDKLKSIIDGFLDTKAKEIGK